MSGSAGHRTRRPALGRTAEYNAPLGRPPEVRIVSLVCLAACGAPVARPMIEAHTSGDMGALLPEHGILIATPYSTGVVTITRLDRDGLHDVFSEDIGNESFGWLEPNVLVTLDNEFEKGLVVNRVVDGKRIAPVRIATDEWSDGSSTKLVLTRSHEVWLTTCKEYPPNSETCARTSYLRVLPTRGKITDHAPPDLDSLRAASAFIGNDTWPLPPTIDGPSNLELRRMKLGRAQTIVTCRDRTRDAQPAIDEDYYSHYEYGFETRSVRWVLESPPIYEVSADITDPVDHTTHERFYVRACDGRPMDHFAWLGGTAWAEYKDNPDPRFLNGTWTVHVGATPIGEIDGLDAMRANTP
jgi:hypothetical protein